jgi:rod shape-determining protein MreC
VNERRTGWLLIAILLVQLVFVAVEGARRSRSYTYVETAGLRLLGPVARLVSSVAGGVSGMRNGITLQSELLAENRRLLHQVEDLQLRLLRLGDLEQEVARLGDAVRYQTPLSGRIRAADVVYADHASWLRTLVLYCGTQPARVNQPVLAPLGLVGRVVAVAGPYAKVQLITDRAASVGGMILRNRRQGVVRGSGQDDGGLNLDYVPLSADVRPGDQVLTAGIDGVYPRGIPVGTVVSVEAGGQLFHRIVVAPGVDFGTLDQVYLLEYAGVPAEVEKAVPGAHR